MQYVLLHVNSSGSGADTLYFCDDNGNTAPSGAAIYKYCFNGTTWSAKGSATLATAGGLTAIQSGTTVTLYATSGTAQSNLLNSLTDSSGFNGTLSGTPSSIATAGAFKTWRGVALAPISAPVVTASAATAIGATAATLNGNVSSDGGATVTDRGFVYKTSSGVTISDNKTTVSGTTGSLTLTPALGVNTQYYFKAYAINSVGTTLSTPELYFWTLANTPAVPAVGNPTTSSLDVTIGGGDGNPSTTIYAIHETTQNTYVQADGTLGASAVYQTAATWSTKTVTGLSASSTYTFEVKAQNGGGTATIFGASANGTTSTASAPTISISPSALNFSPVVVGGTSANMAYSVSGLSLTANIVITAPPNFEISTASVSGFGGTVTLTQVGGTVASTNIYVHFKPTAQTAYSDNVTNFSSGANNPNLAVSGLGANVPSLSTQPASAIATTGATLNGTIISSNNAVITDRGFYWKTAPGVSPSDTPVSEGGSTVAAYTVALTGLGANTIYYYRAYASNAIGTTLDSADTSFYTLANTPIAPAVSGATTTTLNVAIGADGNPAGTAYLIQETNSGNFVQADGTLGAPAVYQPAATWGTTAVTNLSLGTAYVFQVQATNGAGVATAFGPATSAHTLNVSFGVGDLVVERMEGATSGGTPVSLVEYNTAGTLQQAVPLPNAATRPSANPYNLMDAGSSTSNGQLSRSADGTKLIVPGYNGIATDATIASSSAGTVSRTIGVVNNAAAVDTSRSYNMLSGNNYRSVASTDGTVFWAAGAPGLVYVNASGTLKTNCTANVRVVNIFNHTLYYSTGSGTPGIYQAGTAGTLPTTATATNLLIAVGGSSPSPYGFSISPDGTVAYVADDRSIANGGGIIKYTNSSGTWSSSVYTLSPGTGSATTFGARGLVVDWSGANPVIYATTTEAGTNRLITITDTGIGSDAATLLATAGASQIFRGVAFAPKVAQTIAAIAATAAKNYGDSSYSVATTASSGLAVTYASDTPSVATVDAGGNVTIVGAGTVHITVSQAGNDTYAAAPSVAQALTVSPLAASVTADAQIKNYGDMNPPLTATVVGTINGDTLNYTLATDATQFSAVGTSNITVTLGSNPNYSVLTTNSTLTISPLAASVTADAKSKNYGDANPPLTATVVGTINGDTLNYSLATDATQFSGVGTSNITVTLGSNPNYNVLATNSTLTIIAIQATPTFNLVSSANPSGFHGSVTFTANTILPADVTGTIQFTTNGGNLGGAVTISGGSATSPATASLPRGTANAIQAIYSGDANYLSITNTLTQTVTNHSPVAGANTYYRNGLNNWKIAISDLLTNASDSDGDTLTLIGLGVSTNLVTLDTSSTPGFAQYANLNHVDDQFTYTVADNYGGTNTATITLAFSLTGSLTGTNTITRIVPGNPATLTANGVINFTYITQRSTNLASPAGWVNIQTNTAVGGVITTTDHFSDLGGIAPAQTYYRIKWSN